ncbi:MAG: HEAT repeat domain-containing protein [Promethearchaeota archaeon]
MTNLRKLLEDGAISEAIGLVSRDEDLLEDLIGLLEDTDEDIQRSAFEVVSQTSSIQNVLEAIPTLIGGLESDEDEICRFAAEALYFFGPDAADATESLANLLDHDDDDIRRAAARTLRAIGAGAVEALQRLIEALQDSDETVRGEAALSIGNIGSDDPEPIPSLVKALADEEEFEVDGKPLEVRHAAQQALKQLGNTAVPGLLEALRDDRAELRLMAVETLASIPTLSDVAIELLEATVNDPDSTVSSAAQKAIKQINATK